MISHGCFRDSEDLEDVPGFMFCYRKGAGVRGRGGEELMECALVLTIWTKHRTSLGLESSLSLFSRSLNDYFLTGMCFH